MYADFEFWLALLTENADSTVASARADADDLAVSLVTFVQLFLLEEDYEFDRERAITAILTLADYDGDPDVLYRASTYRERGLDTFQSFHAAMAVDGVVSPSSAYDDVDVQRRWAD